MLEVGNETENVEIESVEEIQQLDGDACKRNDNCSVERTTNGTRPTANDKQNQEASSSNECKAVHDREDKDMPNGFDNANKKHLTEGFVIGVDETGSDKLNGNSSDVKVKGSDMIKRGKEDNTDKPVSDNNTTADLKLNIDNSCKLKELGWTAGAENWSNMIGPVFFSSYEWRKSLCRCSNCLVSTMFVFSNAVIFKQCNNFVRI